MLSTFAPGQTTTCGGLAIELGLGRGGARAIGVAVGTNPAALIVPCHRVGARRKHWLLRHEGVLVGAEPIALFG